MIGSMFVGFIVGLIAAAITNRGESRLSRKNPLGLVWILDWSISFWSLGANAC